MKTLYTGYAGIFLAGIIFFAIFTGCGKKPAKKVRVPRTIVFFGDSITYGYGVDREKESFYARISKIMESGLYGDIKTINAGASGDDTSEALKRVKTDVSVYNPDIVVIAFGLNDCQNNSMTPQKFRENILSMVAAMPAKTRIVLATSNTFLEGGRSLWKNLNDSFEKYMKELRNLARDNGYPIIYVNTAWGNHIRQDERHKESLYTDPTHPSAKGHRLIYETYMDVLRKIIME